MGFEEPKGRQGVIWAPGPYERLPEHHAGRWLTWSTQSSRSRGSKLSTWPRESVRSLFVSGGGAE
jgi:hypothetical protein